MEQHFIAVTEKAPRLRELEEGLARIFLRDYDSYANRVESVEDVVLMRRCLEKDDLDELLVATESKILTVTEAPSWKSGIAAAIAAEDSEDQSGDDTSEKESEGNGEEKLNVERFYIRLSNEHVSAMIISYVGPEEVTASAEISI